jgi:hypothetical protein
MTDLTTAEDAPSVAPASADAPQAKLVKVALKNGAGEIDVDVNQIPEHVWNEVILQGLKAIAERATSKATKAAYPDEAERKGQILAIAKANVADMYAGKTKLSGQKAAKVAGKVMTEAMRLARNLIKDALRKAKRKQNSVTAKELTAAAKAYIAANPSIVATAEANLKAREETPQLDLGKLLGVDVSKLAEVTPPKPPMSKTQAGKVAPRAKGAKGKTGAGAQASAPTQPQATPTA